MIKDKDKRRFAGLTVRKLESEFFPFWNIDFSTFLDYFSFNYNVCFIPVLHGIDEKYIYGEVINIKPV